MQPESRAEYFRERRKKLKQIVFMIEPEKAERLDDILRKRNETRAAWFRRIVDREISNEE